jgi:hypothetical protein
VRRNSEAHKSAAAVLDDHEQVEPSECRRDRHEAVTGDDRARVIAQAGRPTLIAARLRIRLTLNEVEIFLNGERLALHPRDRSRSGKRIKIDAHFPDASIACYEATPQQLLSQSRFIHPDLSQLVVELFNADV